MSVERSPDAGGRRRRIDRRTDEFAADFEDALRRLDGRAAEACAGAALDAGLSMAAVYDHVIAGAMWRVGELWEAGEIGVADEHAATAITHRVMASVYSRMIPRRSPSGARLLLAAIEGQRHAVGIRMAADVLEEAGHEVTYLGADLPTGALIGAIAARRPHLVGLSTTTPGSGQSLAETVSEVRTLAPRMPVIVGGQGVSSEAHDPSVVFVADVQSAVRTVEELVGDPPREVKISTSATVPDGVTVEATKPSTGASTLEATVEIAELMREKAREATQYKRLAFVDAVTDLPNRRAFDDRFAQMISSDGTDGSGALLMIDLDNFKRVNDELGHAAGDRTLAEAAAAIRERLREGDFVARLGGDEFAVLISATDAGDCARVAERIRSAVEERLLDIGVTATIGASRFREGRRATLLAADRALYAAKRAGRNAIRTDEENR